MVGTVDIERNSAPDSGDGMPPGSPWWGQLVAKYGPWAALAGFLVYFITNVLSADVKEVKADQKSHVAENRFFLHQICVLLAKNAGEPAELCNTSQAQQGEHGR